jgi:hypothetical protein
VCLGGVAVAFASARFEGSSVEAIEGERANAEAIPRIREGGCGLH